MDLLTQIPKIHICYNTVQRIQCDFYNGRYEAKQCLDWLKEANNIEYESNGFSLDYGDISTLLSDDCIYACGIAKEKEIPFLCADGVIPVWQEYVRDMINSFDLDAKIVTRKKTFVVYLKEGSQIVDALNIMEAHIALMELENVRILKEMRNSVNRKVNCETANINKTVSAAVRQMEDIVYVRDTVGLDYLPEGLRDVALTRLENPDATLKELGSLMADPVGKSGVNHRLRKISEIADKLRG